MFMDPVIHKLFVDTAERLGMKFEDVEKIYMVLIESVGIEEPEVFDVIDEMELEEAELHLAEY